MCEWGNQVVLIVPNIIPKERRTACIDVCIVPQITALWSKDIITFGCCCGHGEKGPSIIVSSSYNERDFRKIRRILEEWDPTRRWSVLQWRLTDVALHRMHP